MPSKSKSSHKRSGHDRRRETDLRQTSSHRNKAQAHVKAKQGEATHSKANEPNYFADHPLERKTQHLIIRPLKASDFEAWRDGLASFHSPKNRWDEGGVASTLLNRREFRRILNSQKKNRARDFQYDFAVFDRETGSFIGSTALMDISRAVFQNAYIGYWIGNTCWGKGLGKEAVDATINIAFNDLQLHRVEAGIAPENKRSIRLARALGMRREGRSLRRLLLRGQWQDMLIYALTAEER